MNYPKNGSTSSRVIQGMSHPNPPTRGQWSSARVVLEPCGCATSTPVKHWRWFVSLAVDAVAIG